MPFHVNNIYEPIARHWRKKRFDLFLRVLRPKLSDSLLDVGGFPYFWLANPPVVQRIDTLNLDAAGWEPAIAPDHHLRALTGDGCALEFPDGSYDIAFSNSVIEHLTTWERQCQFAAELRRVGKSVWVQTPAYECPIEPHYMMPFIHYLPAFARRALVRWFTPRGWIERPNRELVHLMVETIRLLSKAEMRRLFPDCDILTERLAWIFPKSYIAVRKGN